MNDRILCDIDGTICGLKEYFEQRKNKKLPTYKMDVDNNPFECMLEDWEYLPYTDFLPKLIKSMKQNEILEVDFVTARNKELLIPTNSWLRAVTDEVCKNVGYRIVFNICLWDNYERINKSVDYEILIDDNPHVIKNYKLKHGDKKKIIYVSYKNIFYLK